MASEDYRDLILREITYLQRPFGPTVISARTGVELLKTKRYLDRLVEQRVLTRTRRFLEYRKVWTKPTKKGEVRDG